MSASGKQSSSRNGKRARPVEDEGDTAHKPFSPFTSPVYSVSVGPHKAPYHVHGSVLSQSPVLERMFAGAFKESILEHVDLPEDDEDTFAKLLDYLYSGDYAPRLRQATNGTYVAHQYYDTTGQLMKSWAKVYIMADKYDIQGLKAKTASKMQLLEDTPATIFFDISQNVYNHVPDSDSVWRANFRAKAREYLMELQLSKVLVIIEKLLSCHPMLVDIFQTQCQIIKDSHKTHSQSHGVCGKCLK